MPAKEKKNKHSEAPSPESIYVNRELSWLEFNRRVLLEAADPTVPLLERLKFLMIYQSNLEEFYRVRIVPCWHRTRKIRFPDSCPKRRSRKHCALPGISRR